MIGLLLDLTGTLTRRSRKDPKVSSLRRKSWYNSREIKFLDEDSLDEIVIHTGRPPSVNYKDIENRKRKRKSILEIMGLFTAKRPRQYLDTGSNTTSPSSSPDIHHFNKRNCTKLSNEINGMDTYNNANTDENIGTFTTCLENGIPHTNTLNSQSSRNEQDGRISADDSDPIDMTYSKNNNNENYSAIEDHADKVENTHESTFEEDIDTSIEGQDDGEESNNSQYNDSVNTDDQDVPNVEYVNLMEAREEVVLESGSEDVGVMAKYENEENICLLTGSDEDQKGQTVSGEHLRQCHGEQEQKVNTDNNGNVSTWV